MIEVENLPKAGSKQIELVDLRRCRGLHACLKLQENKTIRPSSLRF